jgi:hypothetical protein
MPDPKLAKELGDMYSIWDLYEAIKLVLEADLAELSGEDPWFRLRGLAKSLIESSLEQLEHSRFNYEISFK